MVEHLSDTEKVGSSILPRPTSNVTVAQQVEHQVEALGDGVRFPAVTPFKGLW